MSLCFCRRHASPSYFVRNGYVCMSVGVLHLKKSTKETWSIEISVIIIVNQEKREGEKNKEHKSLNNQIAFHLSSFRRRRKRKKRNLSYLVSLLILLFFLREFALDAMRAREIKLVCMSVCMYVCMCVCV